MDIQQYQNKAKEQYSNHKNLVKQLKRKKPKNLDARVAQFHEEVFETIDCLDCANCCKSISPIISDNDIRRIAKSLKIKPGDFVDQYLELDQENDYVFKSQPCPFLGNDNYCSIYDSRPKACAEYPHTDRKRFHQILDLSLKNTIICPAVTEVFDKLQKTYS